MFQSIAVKGLLYVALAAVPIGAGFYVAKGHEGEIKVLKEDVGKKTKEIEDKKAKITNLEGDVKKLKSENADLKLINQTNDEIKEATGKVTAAEKLIDTKVADIEAKFKAMPQTDNNLRAKQAAVSMERSKGLWLSYCIANPKHARCVPVAPATTASAASSAK